MVEQVSPFPGFHPEETGIDSSNTTVANEGKQLHVILQMHMKLSLCEGHSHCQPEGLELVLMTASNYVMQNRTNVPRF